MAITVLTSPPPQPNKVAAGDGFLIWKAMCKFNNNDSSGTLTVPFAHIKHIKLCVVGGGSTTGISMVQIPVGTISATLILPEILAPVAGSISFVKFVNHVTITNSDANYWKFKLLNSTQTLTPVYDTVAGNSTKATGGSTVSADTVTTLINSTAASDLVVAQYDVLQATITKTDTAPNLTSSSLIVGFAGIGSGAEDVVVDELAHMANGVLGVVSNAITISRRGSVNTSNLVFDIEIEGTES